MEQKKKKEKKLSLLPQIDTYHQVERPAITSYQRKWPFCTSVRNNVWTDWLITPFKKSHGRIVKITRSHNLPFALITLDRDFSLPESSRSISIGALDDLWNDRPIGQWKISCNNGRTTKYFRMKLKVNHFPIVNEKRHSIHWRNAVSFFLPSGFLLSHTGHSSSICGSTCCCTECNL